MKVLGIREIPVNKIEIIQGLLPRVETHTIEDKIEEYKEAMELGSEFPPITLWQKGNEEYWLIDGMHRLMASKRLGKETIKAEIVELKDMLEAKVVAITKNRHGLPLTKQEKRVLCQNLYMEGLEIQELMKIFGISERTIYYWTSGLKRKTRDDEVKEKALEMRRQGYTQEQVAEELGVSKMAISKWERESKQPAKIADCLQTDPSEEEPEDPLLIKMLDFARRKGIPEDVVMRTYENLDKEDDEEELEELREIAKQKLQGLQQKRSNGGRPPNDPPPATDEEEYKRLKDELVFHMEKIALKIGWTKALPMFEEALEEIREVSKTAKRGW